MSSYELRKCPFCGSSADIVSKCEFGGKTNLVAIRCNECGARTKEIRTLDGIAMEDSIDQLVEMWNTRKRNTK